MTDQERMRRLRKHHSAALDEVALDLIEYKDNHVHGSDRATILQLARFLAGDADQPFPEER